MGIGGDNIAGQVPRESNVFNTPDPHPALHEAAYPRPGGDLGIVAAFEEGFGSFGKDLGGLQKELLPGNDDHNRAIWDDITPEGQDKLYGKKPEVTSGNGDLTKDAAMMAAFASFQNRDAVSEEIKNNIANHMMADNGPLNVTEFVDPRMKELWRQGHPNIA